MFSGIIRPNARPVGFAALTAAGRIGGGTFVPPVYIPAFKFNDTRNSMYLGMA